MFEGNELLAEKKGDKLDLCQLSSGERRLLTLLLNCVYSSENWLLIDEPEVSLSLNYQSNSSIIFYNFINFFKVVQNGF